jgi:hypothetical protein
MVFDGECQSGIYPRHDAGGSSEGSAECRGCGKEVRLTDRQKRTAPREQSRGAAALGLSQSATADLPHTALAAFADIARAGFAAAALKATARGLEPVSVFVSRKTQRLYVRQRFQPVFDIPITLQDPDRPIGTHVFTALKRIQGGAVL